LVTVADAQGLSYYSDGSLTRELKLDGLGLSKARRQLIDAELIAYQKPLYQVLGIVQKSTARTDPGAEGPTRSVNDILRQALGGAA